MPRAIHKPPAPTPPADLPAGAMAIRKADDPAHALAKAKDGQTIGLERGGSWTRTLEIPADRSDLTIMPFGTGGRPLVTAPIGVLAGGKVQNLTVRGIDFVGTPGTRGEGARLITTIDGATFDDCSFRSFRDAIALHHPLMDRANRKDWLRRVLFNRCRLLDSSGPNDTDGQGGYFADTDDLAFTECFIDNNGWTASRHANIFIHGLYIAAPNSNVRVQRCIVSRNASYGVQCRPPSLDTDNAASDVSDNLLIDNAIGILINGHTGTCNGNVIVPGHFHTDPWHHGQGGIQASIGQGSVQNNLVIGGPAPQGQEWRMPAFDFGPRTSTSQGWEYRGAFKATTANNIERRDIPIDLAAIIASARAGGDIGQLCEQGKQQARTVAGMTLG